MAKRAGKKRPRQADLPGTEDGAIKPLEDAAKRYAAIRDERMELNEEEGKLKAGLLALMKKHNRTTYTRHGITISVIPEGESIKVKIRKPGDDQDQGGE